MDRRTLLALALTAIVIVLTPMLFPAPRQQRRPADTSRGERPETTKTQAPSVPAPTQPQPSIGAPTRTAPAPTVGAETTTVQTQRGIYRIVSPGGTIASVILPEYHSLRRDAPRQTPVTLLENDDRLLRLTLAGDRDTIALDNVAFRAEPQRRMGNVIEQSLTSVSSQYPITLTYRFPVDSFVAHLTGSVAASSPQKWRLLVAFPARIRTEEADTVDDTRHLAVGFKAGSAEVQSVSFRQLDPGATRVDTGTIRWVAERNKYFVVAAMPELRDSAFQALVMRGGVRNTKEATHAYTTAVLPLTSGTFALKVYAGPQSWAHLHTTAPDLENVNPYGG